MEKSAEEVHTVKAFGWAARDHSGILSPFEFSRRAQCPLSFHVTCGLKEHLRIEYREGMNKEAIVSGFCKNWLWKKTG
ncbi:Mannitol dehydrogenase [Camellia lanceoleosa]|uniref:Mannitol dehydrogenase n=1 Tax=Camellia lanceoleosa TaxID=1840588 RepID=A0ACC0H581_9ERIC|nr:Mannitol dehydrogenase [Camellia lanceoleosa]